MTDFIAIDKYSLVILLSFMGLLFGSFFNVVAIRIPKNESISFPPSHCMKCNHRLGVLDLIPVFGYLFLRGRCRYCSERISPIYPFGEFMNALLFGVVTWNLATTHQGFHLEIIVGLFLTSILVISMLSDLHYRIIPNKLMLFAVIVGLGLRIFIHEGTWLDALIQYGGGLLLGGGLILLIFMIGTFLFRKEAMGGGDLKLFAVIGLLVGMKLVFLCLFFASLAGSIYGLFIMLTGKFEKWKEVPFAPFIMVGTITGYLWGSELLDWYLNLITFQ